MSVSFEVYDDMFRTKCIADRKKKVKIPPRINYSKPPRSWYKPSSCALSKVQSWGPSTSGMSASPGPSPVADDPSALPSPTFSPTSSSNSLCLSTQCQPLCSSCHTVPLYFPRYHTVRSKMLSQFFVCLLCTVFGKHYKPITIQYSIAEVSLETQLTQ